MFAFSRVVSKDLGIAALPKESLVGQMRAWTKTNLQPISPREERRWLKNQYPVENWEDNMFVVSDYLKCAAQYSRNLFILIGCDPSRIFVLDIICCYMVRSDLLAICELLEEMDWSKASVFVNCETHEGLIDWFIYHLVHFSGQIVLCQSYSNVSHLQLIHGTLMLLIAFYVKGINKKRK